MSTKNKSIATALLIMSCWTFVRAQEFEIVKVDTSLIAVNVLVTDEKKRCVSDLRVEHFRVIDQGMPVTIEFFDNRGPASIVFVIDTSASMYKEKWEHLKRGLQRFLKHTRDDNDYTLILFDDYPRLVAESVTPKELSRRLEEPNKIGNTALYDALLMGLRVTGRLPRRQKALVLLSDGQDTRSRAQFSEVQQEAMAQRATIYAVGIVPTGRNLLGKEFDGKEILNKMALATGGIARFPSPTKISDAIKDIQNDLNSQYTLSYYASDKTPGWRNVRINVISFVHPVTLRYQQRYLMKGEAKDHARTESRAQ